MSELGLGVPRDLPRALALYKKAAARDVIPAQLRLGEIYLHGNLVPPDFAQAKGSMVAGAMSHPTKDSRCCGMDPAFAGMTTIKSEQFGLYGQLRTRPRYCKFF